MKSKSTPQLDQEEKTPGKGELFSSLLLDLFISLKQRSEGLLNCFVHICGLYSIGVNVQQHLWMWERPLPGGSNTQAQSLRAASEQNLKRRYIFDSIRLRTLERGGLSPVTAASLPN